VVLDVREDGGGPCESDGGEPSGFSVVVVAKKKKKKKGVYIMS
jgi:hypothetical protein